MSSLPSGVRRVYNTLYKRKATGGMSYTPSPSKIKDYFESKGFNLHNITDEEFNQTISHFSKGELSLPQIEQSTEIDSHGQSENVNSTESSIVFPTQQQIKDIVSTKAIEMSLELSTLDVEYVASQIDSTDTTLDDVLQQVESLLCAYADHKQQESIQKIDSMFGRVYSHVQFNNSQTSRHLSQKLRQFGTDVEQAQEDFKSSIGNALERLKIPGVSA
ncbi:MAG: hypothetical protein RMY28_036180 [Nostoc sp. ChiSLP01]|nr:hypothetical protein [Nostoc sp. CmiSLP01]MDZ8282555.1 hypothetical protein [Nostoc sp. ChiSLP01]